MSQEVQVSNHHRDDRVIQVNHLLCCLESLHLEYLICETFLQLLACIPSHTIRSLAVCRVLLELYNKRRDVFSSSIALGALLVYQMLPMMDYAAIQEYAKWLAFHLTNTRLSWPYWDHWVNELREDVECAETAAAEGETESDGRARDMEHADGSNQAIIGFDSINGMFCRMVVDRLARIFIPSVTSESLPPALQPWVPSIKDALSVHVDLSSPVIVTDLEESVSSSLVLSTRGELASVGERLKALIQEREDTDKVEQFLDQSYENLDSSSDIAESWRAAILLKVILLISGQVLSVLSSLSEKYSSPLRSYGESITSQAAMIRVLAHAYHLNGSVFSIVLDILVRRGILQPAAIAIWLTTYQNPLSLPIAGLRGLGSDIYVYSIVTGICERAMDFVKASIAARLVHGEDMVMDESLDVHAAYIATSNLSVASTIPTTIASSTHASASSSMAAVEEEDEDEVDDDGDGRRSRHPIIALDEQVQVMEDEEADLDPKAQASEIVVSALMNSRSTYKTLVTSLLDELIPIERANASSTTAAASLKPWPMTALSLLRHVLLIFHQAEEEMNEDRIHVIGKSKIVLTDAAAVQLIIRKHGLSEEEMTSLASVASVRSYLG
jgi:hypothetical protein